MRPALLLALLCPLPALAQSLPQTCTVSQQCMGGECTANPGVTLHLEPTATGIVSWDAAVPHERVELTTLPGAGAPAWSGRAPAIDATVLMTQVSATRIQVVMHSLRPGQALLTADLDCGAAPPPAPSKRR